MKKLFQSLSDGSTSIEDVTPPSVRDHHLVIKSTCSLVSTGTERMLVEFGKASLIGKAKQQPEKVRQVLNKVRTDGVLKTYDTVKAKLDKSIELGYSNVGIVAAIGEGVRKFSVGDRVVSNGPHAEMICVPENLCARIPKGVDSTQAAFTVVSSIGLQGIRLANLSLGEKVAVFGTGLIGLLTIQMLKAHGCEVVAFDIEAERLKLADQFGAKVCNSRSSDPIAFANSFTKGVGVDAVIITASTESNEIIAAAAQMSRKRGRIILVGVTGLNLNRSDFYEKELSFQVSCSYGPGRYDTEYEDKGHDYPVGFVRWTEQRNFEAVLTLMASDRLATSALVSRKYKFVDAADAYNYLVTNERCLGLLLEYDENIADEPTLPLRRSSRTSEAAGSPAAALIGYGNYSSSVLVPALKKSGISLHTVVTRNPVHISANTFEYQSNSIEETLSNDAISVVIVSSRHCDHAEHVISALNAGKHVFVEKPLCLTLNELDRVQQAYSESSAQLMVGFNRRFAPLITHTKALLKDLSVPVAISMNINAGHMPPEHWMQDKEFGGGRIIGEACHFIDLLRFLVGATIESSHIFYMDSRMRDTAIISLKFADGSIGNINYFADGHPEVAKERLEVFAPGKYLQLDNYRKLHLKGWTGEKSMRRSSQNKGNEECLVSTMSAFVSGTDAPIEASEIFEVSRIAVELANSASVRLS